MYQIGGSNALAARLLGPDTNVDGSRGYRHPGRVINKLFTLPTIERLRQGPLDKYLDAWPRCNTMLRKGNGILR
jgi:hypothetical protein